MLGRSVNTELERFWKEAVILDSTERGKITQNLGQNSQAGGPRFELSTSSIEVYSIIPTPNCSAYYEWYNSRHSIKCMETLAKPQYPTHKSRTVIQTLLVSVSKR
jgi:hypothetical protein